MLVLTRKEGEQIAVPECGLTVTVLHVNGKKVRLGIAAPPGVAVHRKEVMDRIARSPACEEAASAATEEPLMSVRVLIADPDEYLLDSWREHLERHGFEVATATSGLECVERLRKSAPDVLVMEASLPWGGGDGVLALMYEDADVPFVPVIVLTDGRDRSLIYRLAGFHVQGYQVKPISARQLQERIQVLVWHRHAAEQSAGGRPGASEEHRDVQYGTL